MPSDSVFASVYMRKCHFVQEEFTGHRETRARHVAAWFSGDSFAHLRNEHVTFDIFFTAHTSLIKPSVSLYGLRVWWNVIFTQLSNTIAFRDQGMLNAEWSPAGTAHQLDLQRIEERTFSCFAFFIERRLNYSRIVEIPHEQHNGNGPNVVSSNNAADISTSL